MVMAAQKVLNRSKKPREKLWLLLQVNLILLLELEILSILNAKDWGTLLPNVQTSELW